MAKTTTHSHAQPQPAGAGYISPEKDFEAHVNTYRGFLRFAKWVIVVFAVVMVALYFIVQPHIVPPAS